MGSIAKGDIIQGARWPEPVRIEFVEELHADPTLTLSAEQRQRSRPTSSS
jgi:hypothetical protein